MSKSNIHANRDIVVQQAQPMAAASAAALALAVLGDTLESIARHIHRNKTFFSFQTYEKPGECTLAVAQMSLHTNPWAGPAGFIDSRSPDGFMCINRRWMLVDPIPRAGRRDRFHEMIRRDFGRYFPDPNGTYNLYVSIDRQRVRDGALFYVVVPLFDDPPTTTHPENSIRARVRANNFYLRMKLFPQDAAWLRDDKSNDFVRDVTIPFFGGAFGRLMRLGNEDTFLTNVNERARNHNIELESALMHT